MDGYKAIFIGTGVWNPKFLNIKGESLGNVHYAIDYLKAPNVYNLGKRICIIGAGNVAMDAARTAIKNGIKEVYILYRKGFEDMSATKAEIESAKKDGIKFELFKSPLEIFENGIKYIKTKNIINKEGNVTTDKLEGTERFFEVDSVIIAVSQSPKNNIVSNTTDIETNIQGLILSNEFGYTTRKGVFASGDVVTGGKTVVEAVAKAKIVADSIDTYCSSSRNSY